MPSVVPGACFFDAGLSDGYACPGELSLLVCGMQGRVIFN